MAKLTKLALLVRKVSSPKRLAMILLLVIVVAAALAVFAGRTGLVLAVLVLAVVFAGVIMIDIVTTRRSLRQLRTLVQEAGPEAIEAFDTEAFKELSLEAEIARARADESQAKVWQLARALMEAGSLGGITNDDLERRFARSAHDPTIITHRLPSVGESGGERFDDRARALRKYFQNRGEADFVRLGTICSGELEERLNSFGPVTTIETGLGVEQLPTDLGYVIIDENSFDATAWAGVLDAQHTVKFMELHSMLSTLKQRGVSIVLIEREVASHFSDDLRKQADLVHSPGELAPDNGEEIARVVRAYVQEMRR